ncbi:reverse transcriptase domain-containing protein [Tanacetum coccineum]
MKACYDPVMLHNELRDIDIRTQKITNEEKVFTSLSKGLFRGISILWAVGFCIIGVDNVCAKEFFTPLLLKENRSQEDTVPRRAMLNANLNDVELGYADYVNYLVGKVVPPKWTSERRKRFYSQVKNYFWDEYAFKLLCPDNIMRRCVAGSEIYEILAHWRTSYCFCHWKKAQALPTNDARVVVKFLRGLFARFEVPKVLISDRGMHFCNSQLEKALQKYGVTHKLATAYHPQSNGQTQVTNRAIKRILETSVGYNPKDWSKKLNDALWDFRTAYKTSTGLADTFLNHSPEVVLDTSTQEWGTNPLLSFAFECEFNNSIFLPVFSSHSESTCLDVVECSIKQSNRLTNLFCHMKDALENAGLSICPQQDADSYVFEFLWPQIRDQDILNEALLTTLERHFPSFKFLSPSQIVDNQGYVKDIDNSPGNGKGNALSEPPRSLKRKFEDIPKSLDDDVVIVARYLKKVTLFVLPSTSTFAYAKDNIRKDFHLD